MEEKYNNKIKKRKKKIDDPIQSHGFANCLYTHDSQMLSLGQTSFYRHFKLHLAKTILRVSITHNKLLLLLQIFKWQFKPEALKPFAV